MLFDLAMHGRTAETQLAAACRLLDILVGPPVRRTVTVPVDDLSPLSDEDLRAALARVNDELGRSAVHPIIHPPED